VHVRYEAQTKEETRCSVTERFIYEIGNDYSTLPPMPVLRRVAVKRVTAKYVYADCSRMEREGRHWTAAEAIDAKMDALRRRRAHALEQIDHIDASLVRLEEMRSADA
jgi:hypothetical protein